MENENKGLFNSYLHHLCLLLGLLIKCVLLAFVRIHWNKIKNIYYKNVGFRINHIHI